jgi:hypothetical protein
MFQTPGSTVAEDGELAHVVVHATADALCPDHVPERGGGLKGVDNAGRGLMARMLLSVVSAPTSSGVRIG